MLYRGPLGIFITCSYHNNYFCSEKKTYSILGDSGVTSGPKQAIAYSSPNFNYLTESCFVVAFSAFTRQIEKFAPHQQFYLVTLLLARHLCDCVNNIIRKKVETIRNAYPL